MSTQENRGCVRVNKIALVLVLTAVTALAVVPFVLLVQRTWVLPLVVLLTLLVSAFAIRSFSNSAILAPSLLDFLLGGIGAVSTQASSSFVGIIMYGLVLGITTAIAWVASRLSAALRIDSASWAFWFAAVRFCSLAASYQFAIRVTSGGSESPRWRRAP